MKTYIVCKKPSCWSTNYFIKKRLRAFRGTKVLRQYIATLYEKKTDDEDRTFGDTIEEVVINHTSGPSE